MDDRDSGFTDYFASRGDAFCGTAFLLCGNWHQAEDLVQSSFLKLYRVWPRVKGLAALDAYTRKVLVHTFLREMRRGASRREEVTGEPVERGAPDSGRPEDRLVLLNALAKVPPRQRAVLVLRFWEDLSVEDTAKALGCSVGNVKSQSARGLDKLRDLVPDASRTN
jgi:RNA polymerase sigma-70 factor (sigma-E family)